MNDPSPTCANPSADPAISGEGIPATTKADPATPEPAAGRPADVPGIPDAEAAWRAVAARDAASDGRFVFAVTTTGIYCRPSCPARRPLRSNVCFFADPAAAEAAGFRACRRCRPAGERPDPARRLAEAARDHLEEHLDETVPLARLAEAVGASPWHLQRTFRRVFGQSPQSYVNARRLERVRATLREEKDVTTALYEAGFTSARQLYAQSDARLGMTPGTWRRGGRGARVAFATAPSPVGRVLVAATERGLCSVLLGDDDEALQAALRRELPEAEIGPGGAALRAWVDEVLRRVAGEAPTADLPLDPPRAGGGTDFQRRVWQALTEIPRGETRSYSEVAAGLGRPRAARAVARACATNPLAVVVPCHRVVPASGGPGGYRWGAERKGRLLAGEAAASCHCPGRCSLWQRAVAR
ncbi:MAG TPA: bifunctional DNA-binding transcriptional regulator/O6-methylguanine-DNA methyltransferase Ada [Thermoanaerobaculia bacterium]|nr:bifunctional DNA-binding transcriptional regulator/O6-methylguanine-DNA methyltransferase Ada [Thermoanaerobaculia bacterium]